MDKLAATLTKDGDPGLLVYRFDAGHPDGNIYLGALKLADDVVVGSDSLTMIADAMVTGKRTHALTTMCERPRYLDGLIQGGLLRRASRAGLDCDWQPARVPDPFAVIAGSFDAERTRFHPQAVRSGPMIR